MKLKYYLLGCLSFPMLVVVLWNVYPKAVVYPALWILNNLQVVVIIPKFQKFYVLEELNLQSKKHPIPPYPRLYLQTGARVPQTTPISYTTKPCHCKNSLQLLYFFCCGAYLSAARVLCCLVVRRIKLRRAIEIIKVFCWHRSCSKCFVSPSQKSSQSHSLNLGIRWGNNNKAFGQ